MIGFARACAAIASTASTSEKVERLAAYLRGLADDDLAAAARFFTGSAFAARDERRLSVGGRTVVTVAQGVWNVAPAEIALAYRETGDLGAALGRFCRPPVAASLFVETLTPARLAAILAEVAAASGRSAGKRRALLVERILGACTSDAEARYVIALLVGELRIGLREALVLDALACAFERDPAAVRRANMASGDIGEVALAARQGMLESIAVRYGAPIAFMLATPLAHGGPYRELSGKAWLVEDKYDGIRAQAHKQGAQVRLFSRTLSDLGGAFPEIIAALRESPRDLIADGEIVAFRDGRPLPFRYLQARLARKNPSAELLADVPALFIAFDALAHGEAFLLDRPLAERRALLAGSLAPAACLALAPATAFEPDIAADIVNARFEEARARGNEGLVLKRTDAPYAPGRRGKWWLKLKRELSTIDAVVVAVEWGHGRRHRVLSDYTFAVWSGGRLAVIGKAYSGLTDAEIAEMTEWFEAHSLPEPQARAAYAELGLGRREILVEPEIVVEIAFDIVQKSALHESGFALRFPRIARLRRDKPAAEAGTLAELERIYTEMLAREGVDR